LVIEYEQNSLLKTGHLGLAARVEYIALSDSAAGYDILSFAEDGTEKFIEIKITAGPASTPFYISENEVNVSRPLKERFWLYRVHSYSREENKGEFYSYSGEVEEHYSLSPIQCRAMVK
jgi:hypothetical protein